MLPEIENEFKWHVSHVEDVFAPISVEYFPIPHDMHSPGPVSILYLPAIHLTHGPPSGPYDPALHTQSVFVMLISFESELTGQIIHTLEFAPISSEYVPAAHTEHNASPIVFLYLPAAHEIQTPPFSPV